MGIQRWEILLQKHSEECWGHKHVCKLLQQTMVNAMMEAKVRFFESPEVKPLAYSGVGTDEQGRTMGALC